MKKITIKFDGMYYAKLLRVELLQSVITRLLIVGWIVIILSLILGFNCEDKWLNTFYITGGVGVFILVVSMFLKKQYDMLLMHINEAKRDKAMYVMNKVVDVLQAYFGINQIEKWEEAKSILQDTLNYSIFIEDKLTIKETVTLKKIIHLGVNPEIQFISHIGFIKTDEDLFGLAILAQDQVVYI